MTGAGLLFGSQYPPPLTPLYKFLDPPLENASCRGYCGLENQPVSAKL